MPNSETSTATADRLVELIARYREQSDEFNRNSMADPEGRFPHADYADTLKEMIGVYPRTMEGAQAALDFLRKEGEDHDINLTPGTLYSDVCRSLLDGLASYVADRPRGHGDEREGAVMTTRRTITFADVGRSFETLSLMSVCIAAADELEGPLAYSLKHTLEMAVKKISQCHDSMELAWRDEERQKAAEAS